jgi:tetratricopeptide (TPR) repeat protein
MRGSAQAQKAAEIATMQMRRLVFSLEIGIVAFGLPLAPGAQEQHDHPAPEKLGAVWFPISCKRETQQEFNRGVALLHSFAYAAAESSFRKVAEQDPQCAMAHWGMAMSQFHQLWEPSLPAGAAIGREEIGLAEKMTPGSERERKFIAALSLVFKDPVTPYRMRALNYENAMSEIAAADRKDVEAQVFYALALLSNASPSDKAHLKQKQAAALLEPLYRDFPNHPGIPHYLIHAYDNAELAPRGLAAARAYSKIAPSAPHALHMPSHIFTRLGLWDDSIESNVAARSAARQQGDTGEELHAMDYLVYAYLQCGRDREAAQVIQQLREMPNLNRREIKIGYAAIAMPVRFAVERRQWNDAETLLLPPDSSPLQVVAIAVWARGMGLARNGHSQDARKQMEALGRIEDKIRASGNDYWATQVNILKREIAAWSAQAENQPREAVATMRSAADEEDAIEKLPVTPGPILPAREQLGELLLAQGQPVAASAEFKTALVNAPGRRGALQGVAQAALQ